MTRQKMDRAAVLRLKHFILEDENKIQHISFDVVNGIIDCYESLLSHCRKLLVHFISDCDCQPCDEIDCCELDALLAELQVKP